MKRKNLIWLAVPIIVIGVGWILSATTQPKIIPIGNVVGKTISQIDSIYGNGMDMGTGDGLQVRLYFEKDTIAGYTFQFQDGKCVREIIVPTTPESFEYYLHYLNKKGIEHVERTQELYARPSTQGVNARKIIGKWDIYINGKPTYVSCHVGEEINSCYFINTTIGDNYSPFNQNNSNSK